jgi:hypothetical protein
MSNIWKTHGRTTTHYLQLLNEGYDNQSLFIQSKLHTPHHKKGCKTQHAMVPQIKQHQVATTNNPQYVIKSESLQLQGRKCPIDGQHMGMPQGITCNY